MFSIDSGTNNVIITYTGGDGNRLAIYIHIILCASIRKVTCTVTNGGTKTSYICTCLVSTLASLPPIINEEAFLQYNAVW